MRGVAVLPVDSRDEKGDGLLCFLWIVVMRGVAVLPVDSSDEKGEGLLCFLWIVVLRGERGCCAFCG